VTRPRRTLIAAIALVAVVGGGAALLSSTTTLQGVNFEQRVRPIPVYVKAMEFVSRHHEYATIASEIVRPGMSEAERVLAVFEWTRRNIRPTPDGWTVYDDHILNIIIRGHGVNDQVNDVFATLSTYAGVPAFWRKLRAAGSEPNIFTFARVDGRWVPFDPWSGIVFRNGRGGLAGVEELIADPMLVRAATADAAATGVNYAALISRDTLSPFVPPRRLRADMQRPWPRLLFETRYAIGLEQDE
jgi:hypothetical protein